MSNQQQRRYKIGDQAEVRLRSWTVGKTPKKSTKYIRLVFENYISKDLWLTPKNMERVMKTLEIFGFNGVNLGALKESDALRKDKYVFAVIEKSREYKGRTYYEASFINDPDESFGMSNVDNDLMSDLEGMDTRAYIQGATNAKKESIIDQDYNINTNEAFTCDDIPF